MKIVIAGGTGFLGSPLAETYAEDGHDVRVLTRSLAPGESQPRVGYRRTGDHSRRLEAGRALRSVGGIDLRRGRGHQYRRSFDRRQALESAAQGRAPRQPDPGDAQPGRGDHGCARGAAGLHQLERCRLLRHLGWRPEDGGIAGWQRFPRPALRGLGEGGAARRAGWRPLRHHPYRAWSSSGQAGRWRR